ncbi:hypothetical protein [Aminipila sp.]|uniref:hypothetical protein n=1 Tax=Aminipila sp. TaxID=2060095 RepID=UPI0028A14F93|nr:hypothetical protein [Aminipila sp.]
MKEDLKSVGTMAAKMHYYAFLNEQDVVEDIYSLPTVISDSKYIEIPTNDQSLIGKKYNRTTGKFEDIMFYYAILDDKDIVTQVVALEAKVTDPKKIEISTYDQTLVGKWYNRSNGTFTAPPIHVLAKMSTGEINTLKADGTPEDKWLNTELTEIKSKITEVENGTPEVKSLHTELAQLRSKITEVENGTPEVKQLHTELAEVRSKITEVERGNFGGYKARFKMEDNQMMTEDWANNGKRLTFTFDTGISGYFPKMIRLADDGIEDYFVADFYIVRNTDGTIKSAYMDQDYIGFMPINISDVKGRVVKHGIDMEDRSIFSSEYSGNEAKMYNYGGFYFTGTPYKKQNSRVDIGEFSYNENSFSFTIRPSDTMVGQYTSIDFMGYIY